MSAEIHDLGPLLKRVERKIESGGEPPYDGGMDTARLDKLESFAEATKEKLARIESKLEHIGHDVGQFKWFLLGAALTMVVAVIGTGIGIQQMTVATFQAAGQQSSQSAQPQQQMPPIIINVPGASPSSQAPEKK